MGWVTYLALKGTTASSAATIDPLLAKTRIKANTTRIIRAFMFLPFHLHARYQLGFPGQIISPRQACRGLSLPEQAISEPK
jgi:hypothetical protein